MAQEKKNNNNNKKEKKGEGGGQRFLAIAPSGTAQRLGRLGGLAPHRLKESSSCI